AFAVASRLLEKAATVAPLGDLAVLSLETLGEGSLWRTLKVRGRAVSEDPVPDAVTLSTARRFKGLEASLVIIADADFRSATDPDWRRRLYVACSRARQAVHILTINSEADLGPAVLALTDTEKVRPSWMALARALGVRLAEGEIDVPF